MSTLKVNKLQKTVSGAATFTLPTADGTSGQYMKTDGGGQQYEIVLMYQALLTLVLVFGM